MEKRWSNTKTTLHTSKMVLPAGALQVMLASTSGPTMRSIPVGGSGAGLFFLGTMRAGRTVTGLTPTARGLYGAEMEGRRFLVEDADLLVVGLSRRHCQRPLTARVGSSVAP